jgi:hypothetical protein
MSEKNLMVPEQSNDTLAEFRGGVAGGAIVPQDGAAARLSKLLGSQIMVVVLVLVVSVASLLFMRRQGMGTGMSFQPIKIEYQPEGGRGMTSVEHARILKELAASSAPISISTDQVKKNPFTLAEGPPTESPVKAQNPKADPVGIREEEIRNALANIVLNGVMDGPVPLARVNGRTVRVGDMVSEMFLVGQIHDRAVDLIADNKTYTVSMSDGPSGSGGPGRGGLKSNPMNPRR